MSDTLRIWIASPPGSASLVDQSILQAAGYEVVPVSMFQPVDSWLLEECLSSSLVIVQSPATEGLKFTAKLLKSHPVLPVMLVSTSMRRTHLKQALEQDLVDCLSAPVDTSGLLSSVGRGFTRLSSTNKSRLLNGMLAEHMDGIVLTDLDGRLLLVNPSACDIFLLEAETAVGKHAREVIQHPDFLAIFNPHNNFPYQGEIMLDGGRVFNAHAGLIPGTGYAVILQEITHLKELDRKKTEFVNNVSHDLRSPLTAIYGFVGLIDRVGPINSQQAEFIRHIQSSVQHITSLINDLMDLGRVEADYDVQLEEVSLKDIVTHSLENLDYQLNEKMQELSLAFPAEIPMVLGNPIHLQRMVTNLVENAIKFTPPLGKIGVCCRVEAGQLLLEVSDNGPQIPLADQPHIFEKFYRGSSITQDTPGTGLGLSIVKSIVEKHRGRIWLESTAHATTFTVILPIKY